MAKMLSTVWLLVCFQIILPAFQNLSLVNAIPRPQAASAPASSDDFWMSSIARNGQVAYGDSAFQIYRNVKDFGAKGSHQAPSKLMTLLTVHR